MRGVLLVCLLVACADVDDVDDPVDEAGDGEQDVDEPEDPSLAGADPADDTGLVPIATDEPAVGELALTATQVVYVNFSGPVIYECTSGYCNDAVNRRHHYIRDTWGRHSYDFTSWGTTTQRGIVMDFLRTKFAKYRVVFTTSKPTSGEYTMLLISSSAIGSNTALRGKTDTDCFPTSDGTGRFNTIHRDIAFVVRVGGVSSYWVKRYAAHELAHSFGLLHVLSSSDLMQYKSTGAYFTSSGYDNAHNPSGWRCASGSTQNEPALLARALGLK